MAAPDYRALALKFGVKAFDAAWAAEFRSAAEAHWRGFSSSPGRWNDVSRQLTIGQQFRLAMRHKLIDGEALALAYWMPERVGLGGAEYATSFLLVDPDRLSNPYQMMDSATRRGGVEIDENGVPWAIHVRKAQQNDWYNTVEANTWEMIECEDDDGWRRVYHDFEHDRAGQHRGVGVFTSILGHMKMLARYYGVELQAATVAATFGTYVTSPYDPSLVQDALGADDGNAELGQYQQMRSQWSNDRPALLDGVKVPTLFPGEKIESVASQHPHSNFAGFAHEMLCVFAAATGVSVEQVTQDWSRTNYSSARAALMETWKTLTRRRDEFTANTAGPMYATWLGEAMALGQLPLPARAPSYLEASAQYSRAKWLGPGRGYVDGVKEPQGAQLRMQSRTSTLSDEAGEQGKDWEELLDHMSVELQGFKGRGLPLPEWAMDNAVSGTDSGERSHDPSSPNYRSAEKDHTPFYADAPDDAPLPAPMRRLVATRAAPAPQAAASAAPVYVQVDNHIHVPASQVEVTNEVNPTPVQVDVSAPTVLVDVAAPNVQVASATVQVDVAAPNVQVNPTPVHVDVAAPNVQVNPTPIRVDNHVPPASVAVEVHLPDRLRTSEVKRDRAGNIVSVTHKESDAT